MLTARQPKLHHLEAKDAVTIASSNKCLTSRNNKNVIGIVITSKGIYSTTWRLRMLQCQKDSLRA